LELEELESSKNHSNPHLSQSCPECLTVGFSRKNLPSSTHHSAFAVSTLMSSTVTSWVSLDRHQAKQHLQKCGVKEPCEMSPSKDLKFSH